MSRYKNLLATGETYHIYNRSIIGNQVFPSEKCFQRFINTMEYYSFINLPTRLSNYLSKPKKYKIDKSKKLVDIFAYCIMPNHFHLLVRQLVEKGISIFISKMLNSYVRYFNTMFNRKGPLWEGRFKRVRVESQNQLLHLTRYIHLNPTTSYLVEKPEDYEFSSYAEYINNKKDKFTNSSYVLGKNYSAQNYKSFVMDNLDYQRELQTIKNQLLDS